MFLTYVITGSLVLASCVIWCLIVRAIRRQESALPLLEGQRFSVRPLTVYFVVFSWLGVKFCVGQFVTKTQSVVNLQLACLSGLATLVIGFTLLCIDAKVKTGKFTLGLGLGRSDRLTQIRDGGYGFLACVIPVALVLLATLSIRSPETEHQFLQLLRTDSGSEIILWLVIATTICAPLSEELVFRVVLQGWLQSVIRPQWAILIVAGVFSLVHSWPDMLALYPLGVILGYVFYQRSSFLAVVVVHALFNLTNLTMLVIALNGAK